MIIKLIRVFVVLAMFSCTVSMKAQNPAGISYEAFKDAPSMRWVCPEIEKYQGLLMSLRNGDYKIYADNVKKYIDLISNPHEPEKKYMITQAIMTIENPLYSTDNLVNHISDWLKNNTNYGKLMNVDRENKEISSSAIVNVATHSTFLYTYKVSISPSLVIKLMEDNKLLVSFVVYNYKNDEYSDNKFKSTRTAKVSEVYPFAPKSAYKNSYAQAYVETYLYFWRFISDLYKDLNSNFSRDTEMLTNLHYQYSKDSLYAKYGEVTKVISDNTTTLDINKELRFYESAQKVVFMGETIDFNDILSCEIVDDPTFIPGSSTTVGGGISIFGFGLGTAETRKTPSKTIHNYVVNIKVDNLRTPLIRISTGGNEHKATEIGSAFEYVLRHQNRNNASNVPHLRSVTRRMK